MEAQFQNSGKGQNQNQPTVTFKESIPTEQSNSVGQMFDFGVPVHQPADTIGKSLQEREQSQKEVVRSDQHLDMLVRNANFVDERARELLLSKRTLLQRLFPSQQDKIVEQWKGKMIQSAADFNIKLYEMASEARLESMKEKYTAGLMLLKAHYRQKVGAFMMAKMDELKDDVKTYQFKFLDDMRDKYRKADTVRDLPSLYNRFMRAVQEEEVRYFDFLDSIVTRFEAIVNENLKSYC